MHPVPRLRLALPIAASLISGIASANAQTPLSEIEIRLEQVSCGMIACPRYEVIVHGDGIVEYHRADTYESRVRNISPDDVVAVVNKFLAAHFLDGPDAYDRYLPQIVRQGEVVEPASMTVTDVGRSDLALRIGSRTKQVVLSYGYPASIRELRELVDRIGGPDVWAGR